MSRKATKTEPTIIKSPVCNKGGVGKSSSLLYWQDKISPNTGGTISTDKQYLCDSQFDKALNYVCNTKIGENYIH